MVWLLLLSVAGCARGGSSFELDEDPVTSDGGSADASGDGDGDGDDTGDGDGDSDDNGDGDYDPGDAGAGDGDAPDDPAGDPDAGTPEDMPDMPVDCGFANSCESPRALGGGEVSGDGGSGAALTQEVTGNRSEWFSVHVAELDGSLFTRVDVKFTVRLEITGNANYDLFVYHADNQNDVSCEGPRQSSTNPGSLAEQTSSQVSDVFGADDSRNVRIEVRNVPNMSGDCGSWKLTITGNQ
jgi:hypothetical protein